ncbi:MAG: hypothetical protein ACOC7J_00185, partial [Armatimonadota bacterium]
MSDSIMPDIWGDGKLFTFSGLDGPTHWANTLVGGAASAPLGIVLHLRPDLRLIFGGEMRAQSGLVLGDAVDISVETTDGAGDLRFAFADCWTIVGEIIGDLTVQLEGPTDTDAGFVE